MPVLLQNYKRLFENDEEVYAIYNNGIRVWPVGDIGPEPPDYTEPFYVENISNTTETLSIKKYSTYAPTLNIEYSTDKSTWQSLGTTSTTALTKTLAPGDKLYLKCSTNAWSLSSSNNYNSMSGVSKVGGNIMSLLYGDNFDEETSFPSGSTYNFYNFFRNNTILVDASKILLPATTLSTMCYTNMFYGCTSLTSAPELPATTLISACYDSMFRGCTSLTSAPELPATTLADSCYYDMFTGCTSLTSAPELPATTLASSCYNSMFRGCTSLTSAPELPATTLASSCYTNMFYGCTSLTSAPELPATTLISVCYLAMFYGCTSLSNVTCLATSGINTNASTIIWLDNVSSTGTFYKAKGVTWPTGTGGIPTGWTVEEV